MASKERERLLRLQQATEITARIWRIEISRLVGLQAELRTIQNQEGDALERLGEQNAMETFIVTRLRNLHLQRTKLILQIEHQQLRARKSGLKAKSFERFYEKMRSRIR
jgi:hypothetical protein